MNMAAWRPYTKITNATIAKRICCSCTAVAFLWCLCGVGANKERVPSSSKLETSIFAVFAAERFRSNFAEV